MNIFDQMVARYEVNSNDDYKNAVHEVMQQIALAGLYRGGFFSVSAFYGGTALRIFHGLNRFSEDLDFSLLQPNNKFNLEIYFDSIIKEFKLLGREITIEKKNKSINSNIESAFLKEETTIYNLRFKTEKSLKIKLEVDINPPLGFSTEQKLLLLPFSFMTNCYTLPSLFAGKMHAMLYRSWQNRVKGRDWYDFEWYVRNNIPLDFEHFCKRCQQLNPSESTNLTPDLFRNLLKDKIVKTDLNMVKLDVKPFLKTQEEIEIWSTNYFLQLTDMIKV